MPSEKNSLDDVPGGDFEGDGAEYLIKEQMTRNGGMLDVNGRKLVQVLTSEDYRFREVSKGRVGERSYFVAEGIRPQTIEKIKEQNIEIYQKL